MEITAQIDPTHAERLTYIQQQTSQNLTEIFAHAIALYYQNLNPPTQNALTAFQNAGLVGCLDYDPTTSYQTDIQTYLETKRVSIQ
jgi:hypothetical protein